MDYSNQLCTDVASEVAGRGRRNQAQHDRNHGRGRIGYLVRSKHVLCFTCWHGSSVRQEIRINSVPLHTVNIGQYGQDCHQCGLVLVKALTQAWPELFTREHCGFVDCKEFTR